MANMLLQDVLAKQDGQQDTDGGADEKEEMCILTLKIEHQFTDAVGQLLDDDGGGSCEEACRDAEQQHEAAIRHVGRAPGVELVNPSVEFVLKHFSLF